MFDVDPSQVESLNSVDLVHLLRRLLHAEAQSAGVALGNISVPLQITVPDGGEDGRIVWTEGRPSTDYLPSRSNYFQCKASNFGRYGWKRECWVKSTRRKGVKRKLTPALTSIADIGGSYIGFTTEPLMGQTLDVYTAAIKEGIVEAEGDPSKLASITLYGANEIAAWASRHPAVAVWLAEKAHQQALGGFRTIDAWGQRADFRDHPYAVDDDERYIIGAARARDEAGAENRTTAKAAWSRILEHIVEPGRSVRISGASGLGKSRFVYESLKSSSSQLADIVNNSAVFADYRVVSNVLLQTAASLVDGGHDTLLIVDECPREAASDLGKIAAASGSGLRVITIDTDDRALDERAVFHISISPSEGSLIETIIRARNPDVSDNSIGRLRDICGGFPRFAVLAATSLDLSSIAFETVDDIVDRVLKGSSIIDGSEVRALECLAMFDRISIEGESVPSPLDLVASQFARMSGDEMYEHLAKAQQHDLVGRYGDQFGAQPRPIAAHLAFRRLKVIRPSLLDRFIRDAPDDLVLSLLRRWRYMVSSSLIRDAAYALINPGGHLSTAESILTARGSAIIDALVHIIPDKVSELLLYTVLPSSSQALADAREARRYLVQALSKLVFRAQTFSTAARLLMKLAVAETEDWANNATELFKQLYQLRLSGTEVAPGDRFVILDEGLNSGDDATVKLCVDALESVFRSHFSRFGEAEQIGVGEPLRDWSPRSWDEVDAFHREGLERLLEIRKQHPSLAGHCETILSRATRLMLSSGIYQEHAQALMTIAEEKGSWPEAIEGVGDWLYFDRKGASTDRANFVRDLYSKLFPTDLVERAILFTKFWSSDIRDPDAIYNESDSDFGYSERVARELADKIAADDDLTLEAIRRMTPLDLKSVVPFAERLASGARNRRVAFDTALDLVEAKNGGINMLRGILRGIDLQDHTLADECLQAATQRLEGTIPLINLYSAVTIDSARIEQIVAELKAGKIEPVECAFLSYGRGLDGLSLKSVSRLLDELVRHGSDGAWTALEVAMMYQHGNRLSPEFAREIARLLVNSALVSRNRDRQRDAHVFEDLIKKVRAVIGLDPELADGLATQMLLLAEVDDWEIFTTLGGAMRHVVTMLREDQPETLWAHIKRFHETATPIELNRLKDIIGPNSDRFDKSAHTEAGPLFGLSKQLVFDWADHSTDRAAFLIEFYPTLSADDNRMAWHPDFEELASRYGASKEFRKALAERMRPRSWSGSVIPLLEVYLDPLESWFKHPTRSLAVWAKDQYQRLQSRIERERQNEGQ